MSAESVLPPVPILPRPSLLLPDTATEECRSLAPCRQRRWQQVRVSRRAPVDVRQMFEVRPELRSPMPSIAAPLPHTHQSPIYSTTASWLLESCSCFRC